MDPFEINQFEAAYMDEDQGLTYQVPWTNEPIPLQSNFFHCDARLEDCGQIQEGNVVEACMQQLCCEECCSGLRESLPECCAPVQLPYESCYEENFQYDHADQTPLANVDVVNEYAPSENGNGFVSHGGQSEVPGNGAQNGGGIGSARVHVQYLPGPSKHEPPRYQACGPSAAASPGASYRLLPQSTPNSYPRASTPHRSECYHPTGSTASGFLPGAQPTIGPQPSLRPQPTPQPSAPPAPPAPAAPQLDMSKPALAGHNYVPQQSQSPQSRPQYSNFSYRAQHGTRPNTHPRQQQPYMGGAGNNTAAPVVYHHPTLVFQPHMGLPQGYQQPRSSSSGFYQYVSPYLGYGTPTGHTPPYYYPNNQPMGGTGVTSNNARPGAPLVGPQPTAAAAPAPLPHAPPPPHLHTAMPGVRPTLTKRSHRVPIIDPVTQQEVLSELYNNDTYFVSGEMNERQTPQPEAPPTHTIAEEFSRLVNESIANQQPMNDIAMKPPLVPKTIDMPTPPLSLSMQTQTNVINPINSNLVKSDILNYNETTTLGSDVVSNVTETPVVSAISDSPVIVPKMTNVKQQVPKTAEPSQSPVETKSQPQGYKQNKQKNKAIVPQVEEVLEKGPHFVMSTAGPVAPIAAPAEMSPPPADIAPPPAPVPAPVSAPIPTPAPAPAPAPVHVPVPSVNFLPAYAMPTFQPPAPTPYVVVEPPQSQSSVATNPLTQMLREQRDRVKTEEDTRPKEHVQDKETPKPNGPTSLVHSEPIPEVEHESQLYETETKVAKITAATPKEIHATELSNNNKLPTLPESAAIASEYTTDNIEKSAKESTAKPRLSENREVSSATKAQLKLSQSLDNTASDVNKHKMKDINLNNELADSAPSADANENEVTTLKSENVKEDIYKTEKVTNNPKDKKSPNNINIESSKDSDANDNIESDSDKVSMDQKHDAITSDEESKTSAEDDKSVPTAPKLKYKYDNDQWSPLNQSGKKCYDIGLLMQIKDDPLSKTKPHAPMLEACNIIKPHQEPQPFNPISRPINDSLFPNFAKNSSIGSRSNTPRDPKKDGRNLSTGGKGSMKLNVSPSGSTHHKGVIRVSLTREDVKLNQSKDAWKPTRLKATSVSEEEFKTQELYKKFRGILNKLTPQKFDTLMEKVKTLEINTQSRLEGIIDLVFEKAIDEPNFSEAYANMCNKLASIKVPADNGSPDKYANFRLLIISKCQNQFVTDKVDENVLKLEKEVNECADPVKKKELHLLLEEENRKLRMRSVGNVRFIGELYKLKMLTAKIMVYCMNYLVDKLEEEKLECLCKLLTTIGEQVENEVKEQLELVFKQMQEIVDKKSNKITSRVRFMIKDVIELRQRRWVVKSVVDSQPKMMDQIQKEADQQQRHIELMNSIPMGGGYGRREDGGRGKRGGEGRRQNNNSFIDNNWKSPRVVDMSKLKAGTQKNLSNIKLAPQHSGWNHGSGTKNTVQANSNSMIGITKNKYSMLENSSTDPTLLRANPDLSTSYTKGASIERSTFNSRGDFNISSGSRPRLAPEATPRPATSAPSPQVVEPSPVADIAQEPLPEEKKKSVRSMVGLSLNFDNDEVVIEIQQRFPTQYHAALVTEIINIILEKSAKDIDTVAKTILHIVNLNVLSASNFLAGISEIFEFGPDLYIDIPMLYVYLSKLMTPLIENKHVTFAQVFKLCEKAIIPADHGNLILKAIISSLKESMGVSFVKTKWQESGLEFKQWMNEDQVPKWLEDNKLEYLVKDIPSEESKMILTPAEVESKLLQLMNADETCDCVRGWIQDNVGASREEEWVTRALMAAVCSHALLGGEGARRLSRERMHKYAPLLHELAARSELDCLLAVQRLVHRLEHPQGLTLDIFQYLHEQYIISVEGFITWETSEKEPEGKAVMLKALTSFFTNIREADNEDTCSEE